MISFWIACSFASLLMLISLVPQWGAVEVVLTVCIMALGPVGLLFLVLVWSVT